MISNPKVTKRKVTKKITKSKPKLTKRKVTKKITKNKPKVTKRKVTKKITKNKPKVTKRKVTKKITKNKPKVTKRKVTKKITKVNKKQKGGESLMCCSSCSYECDSSGFPVPNVPDFAPKLVSFTKGIENIISKIQYATS